MRMLIRCIYNLISAWISTFVFYTHQFFSFEFFNENCSPYTSASILLLYTIHISRLTLNMCSILYYILTSLFFRVFRAKWFLNKYFSFAVERPILCNSWLIEIFRKIYNIQKYLLMDFFFFTKSKNWIKNWNVWYIWYY